MASLKDTDNQPSERLVWSWSGLVFALLVGVVVALVFGSILFERLSWLESQFGFAGGWELVFALVMGGVVGGVAGFAATLIALVHARNSRPVRRPL